MSASDPIPVTCWKCGFSEELPGMAEGKVHECPKCGARNLTLSEGEARRRAGFEQENLRCPTCNRWVRRDAEQCMNCGRPFQDGEALQEFLRREPEIKASLARTITEGERQEKPVASMLPLVLLILAAALVFLGVCILLGLVQ